jgi:ribulose kinase
MLVDGGVPVKRFVATGGLPHHNPLLVQIYADVLGRPIVVPSAQQGPALGAAILGVLAAGPKKTGFRSPARRHTRDGRLPNARQPHGKATAGKSAIVRCALRAVSALGRQRRRQPEPTVAAGRK